MLGAVLSGGQNRRIPLTKGFIKFRGSTVIESNVKLLEKILGRVVISANAPEDYFHLGVPVIGDIVKKPFGEDVINRPLGPMAGILSVLVCTGEEEIFVTACDMPFIKPELISYIIGNKKSGEAAVPVFNGRPEPLLAVYSKRAIKTMEGMINSNRLSLMDMLNELDVRYIGEEDVRRIDPDGESFVNINTLDDYEKAFGSLLEREGGSPCLV